MEPTSQATQREITLESLALVRARRPEVQVFNELLVQYPGRAARGLGRWCPTIWSSFTISRSRRRAAMTCHCSRSALSGCWNMFRRGITRKDYDDNMRKYEARAEGSVLPAIRPRPARIDVVPAHRGSLSLGPPDADGRCAIPELDLSLGLRHSWLRFWYQGELLPLPADLQRALDAVKQQLAEMTGRAERRCATPNRNGRPVWRPNTSRLGSVPKSRSCVQSNNRDTPAACGFALGRRQASSGAGGFHHPLASHTIESVKFTPKSSSPFRRIFMFDRFVSPGRRFFSPWMAVSVVLVLAAGYFSYLLTGPSVSSTALASPRRKSLALARTLRNSPAASTG